MSPSDLLATPVLNAFQNVALAIIPSSEVTKWILRSSHDSFVHFCRQKLKQNIWKMVWFSMTLYKFQIPILTVFSVQSKYSKKTKNISLLGFVISNKTCKTWNVQIQCQPSGLSSPSRWKPNSLLPIQKIPNGFISPQMSNFHTPFWDELHSMYSCNPSRLQHISPKLERPIHKGALSGRAT